MVCLSHILALYLNGRRHRNDFFCIQQPPCLRDRAKIQHSSEVNVTWKWKIIVNNRNRLLPNVTHRAGGTNDQVCGAVYFLTYFSLIVTRQVGIIPWSFLVVSDFGIVDSQSLWWSTCLYGHINEWSLSASGRRACLKLRRGVHSLRVWKRRVLLCSQHNCRYDIGLCHSRDTTQLYASCNIQ